MFLSSLISTLILRHSPQSLRLILIDPKQVDLSLFNDIPHLLCPVIRKANAAFKVLNWSLKEMENRYRSMSAFGARDIESFNKIVSCLSHEDIKLYKKQKIYTHSLSYIVIVIEEFADIMALNRAELEQSITRIAQMARASGIHLVLSTQSPRKDIISGLIKTNIPGRISFKVSSKIDSRIILDESGAERLLNSGDMLFVAPGMSHTMRFHAAFISEQEIIKICNFWREQSTTLYDEDLSQSMEKEEKSIAFLSPGFQETKNVDAEVLAYVQNLKEISISHIQRKFRLGYPRAARLVDKFEELGLVSSQQGSKPRKVLTMTKENSK